MDIPYPKGKSNIQNLINNREVISAELETLGKM
jgi:hypothetical protein